MNINFAFVTINRAIMHKIMSKSDDEDSQVLSSKKALTLDEDVKKLINKRLRDSFGKQGKSFELAINRVEADSSFGIIRTIPGCNDKEFVKKSLLLADNLAEQQNKKSIPNGFFLLLDCTYTVDNSPVVIVIKAEPHSAISVGNKKMDASLLKNIILSPSQKMYKAAVFQKKDNSQNQHGYQVLLFDEQFSTRSGLAEYFYNKFLGLTISENNEVLTKKFYDDMDRAIVTKYKDDDQRKEQTVALLLAEMNNKNVDISPREVIDGIINVEDRDFFYDKVITDDMPPKFIKSTRAIQNKISKYSCSLPQAMKLSMPYESIDSYSLDTETDPEYVIVKIKKDKKGE